MRRRVLGALRERIGDLVPRGAGADEDVIRRTYARIVVEGAGRHDSEVVRFAHGGGTSLVYTGIRRLQFSSAARRGA